MDNIKIKGIELDDYTITSSNYGWACVCKKHAKKFPKRMLDENGSGICCVKGCVKDGEHYLDFKSSDIEKAKGE